MGLTAYQTHMKRELKGKMNGKTAAQRKAIFKAAAASYHKRASSPRVSVKGTRSRPVSKLAKIKARIGGNHRTSKGGFNTQKLFKYVRLGALAMPAVGIAVQPLDNYWKLRLISKAYFGYDPHTGKFSLSDLAKGWGPYAAAAGVTYGVPKLISIIRGM